ncbi:MAG: DUF5814 domain-containing protein [Asgard group archaeon]|nr:DUF5814 domain-containing protein [Asgard group archaeon]
MSYKTMPNISTAYYAFLMDYNPDNYQIKMFLLPAHGSTVRIKPLQKAKLQFALENNRLRPYKYIVFEEKSTEYKKPRLIIKVLQKAQGIIIPSDDVPENIELFNEFFSSFDIHEPTIRHICRLCMIDHGRVTFLRENKEYKVIGRKACYQCAKEELAKELNAKKISLSQSGQRHFNRLLRKHTNVDKIMDAFDPYFRPSKRPDLTLYDTIGSSMELEDLEYIDHAAIPGKLKKIIKNNGIAKLLPIQTKALNAGLLTKEENMLVVAGTSTGKTLIGELAGINSVIQGKRMIYLSPLVALTNQKYEDFKKKYNKHGMRVAIRVGMSRIDVGKEEKYIVDTDYRNADIITATYEAFDLLLRNGNAENLKTIGTIIIDEIQLLSQEERGPEIDGLIARIKMLFPKAKILGLSATIGNPQKLARELGFKLLEYSERPIPLERHLVLSRDQDEKEKYLREYIQSAHHQKSSYGYAGQTIVFTNSRKHCYQLSNFLNKTGVRSTVYHSGLTFKQRKKVENGFAKGKYAAVITTAALGAGVDFPASQVIFETLAMGIKWLTVAEFHQMLGRAGRLGFHDKGRVVLLVEANKKYHSSMDETEDSIAFSLLSEPIEPVIPEMYGERQLEQILAAIVASKKIPLEALVKYYHTLLGPSETLKKSLRDLQNLKMITIQKSGAHPTRLGMATTRSYLPPTEAGNIKERFELRSPLEIAIEFEPFTAIYLNAKIHAEIEKTLKGGYIGSNLFSGSVLEFMDTANKRRKKLTPLIIDTFTKWQTDIFNCKCRDNPWCDCGQQELSRIIVKLRLKNKNLREITGVLNRKYNLYAYPGDIYRWLDTLIHHLRAVAKLANVFDKRDILKLALNTIKMIEHPWIIDKHRKKNKK